MGMVVQDELEVLEPSEVLEELEPSVQLLVPLMYEVSWGKTLLQFNPVIISLV